jgi:flagellar biogenesis protein FliO
VILLLILALFLPGSAQTADNSAPPAPAPMVAPVPPPSPELAKKIQDLNFELDHNKASASNAAQTSSTPNFFSILVRLSISLAAVLLLIWALYRLARKVRRMDMPPSEGGKALQLLENYYVGPNQKIMLMRVGESKVLLLGATQNSIQTLNQIDGEEARQIMANANASMVTSAQFSETVNQMLSRFRKDGGK